MVLKMNLNKATIMGDWSRAKSILIKHKDLETEAIRSDGSTMLQIAVGMTHNDFVKNLLSYINDEKILEKRNSDGSTALHIAAIVGNTHAADLLVKKNNSLLRIQNNEGEEPLHKAYEYMHLDTIGYLLKAINDDGNSRLRSFSLGDGPVHPHLHSGVDIGVDLLVNAISAKQYNLASELIEKFPKFASKNDAVLMAIARTFPRGVSYKSFLIQGNFVMFAAGLVFPVALTVLSVVLFILISFLLYICWRKGVKIPVALRWNKMKEWYEAKKVLELVCDEIDKLEFSGNYHPYYSRPILEAACQNAYKVVEEILSRSPESIKSTDDKGYDIFQLAVIYRSEKVYDLIYDIGERKNVYRTIVDTSKNNILHLAGRLAPSHVLNKRVGAALQLQRELQWREEVKKLVFPTYITQENIFGETPDMVFTREHEKLVKEGEKWMKTTAKSCSITAALITTIVFAAAITVPGGSNQATGVPLFRENIAFTVFAVSDAISLFTSITGLLIFLSVLTARFSEKDFLVSLPVRLYFGLFSLFVSTTAMIVAFSATLFLYFWGKTLWMTALICILAFTPIAICWFLQYQLMEDLFWSTHVPIFRKEKRSVLGRIYPNHIWLFIVKSVNNVPIYREKN